MEVVNNMNNVTYDFSSILEHLKQGACIKRLNMDKTYLRINQQASKNIVLLHDSETDKVISSYAFSNPDVFAMDWIIHQKGSAK